ncbi:hypothetical protein E2C01_078947 [Portunus trituberculatus]|uniref:Uncharacterized protein n=1 Tax=Portunus trituberculatus TaxID=210409 RepID=A0A5B7IU94_PORTR|nr:hypothetical protein [Portunus trituberculatus]
MTSVVNYLNHLRKEVARLHVHDPAMTDLCKWETDAWLLLGSFSDVLATTSSGGPFLSARVHGTMFGLF